MTTRTRTLASFLTLLLALGACGKTSDIPAMQAEIVGIASMYTARLVDIEKRGNAIAKRLNDVPKELPGYADASARFQAAGTRFRSMRDDAQRLPAEITKATTPAALQQVAMRLVTKRQGVELPKPGPYKVELQRVMDVASKKFQSDYLQLVSDLAAVDGWLATAEASTVVAAVGETTRPAVVVMPEPVAPPAGDPPPDPGSAPPQ